VLVEDIEKPRGCGAKLPDTRQMFPGEEEMDLRYTISYISFLVEFLLLVIALDYLHSGDVRTVVFLLLYRH
jgi:hypothetical protein